jgi:MFS family permease
MSQNMPDVRDVPADSGLTAFYREMTFSERRTFWACFSGWVLDGMDFMIYPLVIGSIIALWQVDRGTAGLAVTVTLLFSAVGGWLAGFIADRIGRVRTLQLTILWFSVFSLICAFTQSFGQLVVCRALLGLGFGGEWAAGAVLIGEVIRPQFRGRAVGSVQSGWALGWGGAVLMQAALFTVVPPEVAWRWMFAIGALPALLIFFLRRYVEEPEVAVKTRARVAATGDRPSIWEIFAPGLRRTTLLAALLGTGAQGGYYAISTWVPTFLRGERGLTVIGSSGYLAVLISGSFVGYLLGAWLADRIGRRPLFILSSIAAIVLVLVYTTLPFSNTVMLWLGFPLGVASSAYFSGMGAFFTELFPTRLRGSGQGFAYNFGRGIGALFPTLVGYLSGTVALSTAIAVFAVIAYGLLLLAALLLPETRGKVLQADG